MNMFHKERKLIWLKLPYYQKLQNGTKIAPKIAPLLKKKIALKIAARILVRFLYFEVEIAPRDYFFRAANFGVFLEKSRGAKKNRAEKGMVGGVKIG